MKFNLGYNTYIKLKSIIWCLYCLYAIFSFAILKKIELIVGVGICGLIIDLTLMSFLNHWYKYNSPFLLDWFRLTTFISIVLNFMFLVFKMDTTNYLYIGENVVNVEFALTSIFVVFIGLLVLKFCELLYIKKYRKKFFIIKPIKFSKLKFFYVLIILISFSQLYIIIEGLLGYGSVFNSENSGIIGTILLIIQLIIPFALATMSIFKYLYNYKSKEFNLIFWIFFIVQILYGFLSGMKQEVIMPIIIILIPYIISGRKLSKWVLSLSLIFIILLYPINNNYRSIINNSDIDKITALNAAVVITFENGMIQNLERGSDNYSSRLSLFPWLMYSVENEELWNEFKYLNRYAYLPLAWIVPRFIIPNKPVAGRGKILYNMMSDSDNESTAVTPSTFGWSFFEGGFIPVIISFFLLGQFISYIQFNFNENKFFGLLMFIIVLKFMIKVELDIYFIIAGILQAFLVNFLLYKFFFKNAIIYNKILNVN